MSDKKLYQKARKDDALMYIAALIVIVGGLLVFPMFSIGSAIPAMKALGCDKYYYKPFWAIR